MGYNMFSQLTGPNIDINLFPDSYGKGVTAGNAQQTPLSAAVSGLEKGVQTGQQIIEGDQQIKANDQNAQIRQNQIDQLPVTNQLQQQHLQQQTAATTIEQSKARLQSATETLQLQQTTDTLKVHADQAETALQDSNNIKALQESLAASPSQALADAQDPQNAATLIRNPEAAQQIFAGFKASGIPQEQYKDLDASVNGAIQYKAQATRQNFLDKTLQNAAAKKQVDAQNAIYDLNPYIGDLNKDPNFSYNNLDVVSNSRVKDTGFGGIKVSGPEDADSTKGSALVYTDPKTGNAKVLQRFDMSQGAESLAKNLSTAKSYWSTVAPKSPTDTSSPSTPSTGPGQVDTFQSSSGNTANTNQSIADIVAARNAKARQAAVASGNGGAYDNFVTKGKSFVKVPTISSTVNQSQSTPVPPSQPAITRPVGPLSSTNFADSKFHLASGTDEAVSIDTHAANLLGVSSAKVNVEAPPPTSSVIQRVAGIKELEGYSPLIKGMAAIESAGNPFAYNRKSGASGLMQLTDGAQQDEKLTEPFNAQKNVAAGADFLQKRVTELSKALTVASGQQGVPIQPDLRMVLAAYNGGQKQVLNGIAKGYTTWDQMKGYLASVKSPNAAAENLSYPDKVIAATIPFMSGGNLADDNLMKQFLSSGIVEINPFTDV